MVNFGPLAAEIVSLVWGTPGNFNGFRVLAALLYGTVVVGVCQTLRVEQRAPPIFGRAAITLGIGPRSIVLHYFYKLSVVHHWLQLLIASTVEHIDYFNSNSGNCGFKVVW